MSERVRRKYFLYMYPTKVTIIKYSKRRGKKQSMQRWTWHSLNAKFHNKCAQRVLQKCGFLYFTFAASWLVEELLWSDKPQINHTTWLRECHGLFFCSLWCIHSDFPWVVLLWENRSHTKHVLPLGKVLLYCGQKL